LKKRTKKLLPVASGIRLNGWTKSQPHEKSFFVLFFKKHFLFPVCLTRFGRIATANATMASTRAAIYLHIGRNKAGSTTLQDFFAAQAGWLAAHGITYALFGHFCGTYPGLPGYASHLDLIAALRAEPATSMLISNEWIAAMPADFIAPMIRDLAGLDVRVLLYVRPYRAWVQSCYGNALRDGTNGSDFDIYLERLAPQVSVWPALRQWGEGLGWDRVRVRSIDPLDLQNGDLVADCLAAMGVPAPAHHAVPPSNANPNWMVLELLRLASGGVDRTEWESAWLERADIIMTLAAESLAACGVALPPARYLTPAQASWLTDLYNRDIGAIAAHTGAALRPDGGAHATARPFLPSASHIPAALLHDLAARAPDWLAEMLRGLNPA